MNIRTKKTKEIFIFEIQGHIKSGMEFDLADHLEARLYETVPPKFIIDLKNVPYVNSAALGIFLNIFREIEKKNGRFGLCNMSNEVNDLLEITKLDSVLEIYKNQEDALDSFRD